MRLLSSNNEVITLLKGVHSLLPDLGEGTKLAQIVNSPTPASVFPQVLESMGYLFAVFFLSFHMFLIPDAAKVTFHRTLKPRTMFTFKNRNWNIRPTFLQLNIWKHFVWSETREQQCASERGEKEGWHVYLTLAVPWAFISTEVFVHIQLRRGFNDCLNFWLLFIFSRALGKDRMTNNAYITYCP